jgi:hypothetical protein
MEIRIFLILPSTMEERGNWIPAFAGMTIVKGVFKGMNGG